jgi:hypothetical protein
MIGAIDKIGQGLWCHSLNTAGTASLSGDLGDGYWTVNNIIGFRV